MIVGQFRIGEAMNPGPWGLGIANPTGLASKPSRFDEFPEGIFAISKTQLSNVGVARFQAELSSQRSQFKLLHGKPAPPKKASLSSTGGKHLGAGFLTSFPSRHLHGNWSEDVVNSSRCCAAHFLVNQTWIAGGVIYGAAFNSDRKEVQQYTNGLIQHVSDHVLAQPGPKFIGGDFNQHPGILEITKEWEVAGWREIQDIASDKWGIRPSMTCHGKTRKDFLYLSPELQDKVSKVVVDNLTFPDHAVVYAVMDDLSRPEPVPLWFVPSKLMLTPAEEKVLAQQPDLPIQVENCNSNEAYRLVCQHFEQRVDQAKLQVGKHKLIPKEKGRGAILEREFWVPRSSPIKKARQGEPDPKIGDYNLQYKRVFVQSRRLLNMERLINKQEIHAGAYKHGMPLWKSIVDAPGFDPSFTEWVEERSVSPVGVVQSGLFPTLEVVRKCHQLVVDEVAAIEKVSINIKKQQAMHRYKHNTNQVFHEVRDARPAPVEILLAKQKFEVVEVIDEGSIVIKPRENVDVTLPMLGDRGPLPIQHVEEGQVWFDVPHSLREGQEVYQSQQVGSLEKIFQMFSQEWMKRWDKHRDVPEEHWDGIVEFIEETLPRGQMQLPNIEIDEFRKVAASKPKFAAVGLDGVSCRDLANMSDVEVSTLLLIFQRAEQTGQWPVQLTQGAVHSLQKTETAEMVHEYRPITVLASAYRVWSTIRGRQLLRFLENFVTEDMYGSIKGRSAVSMWYGLQLELEQGMIDGETKVGAILDVVKAFNCLPRMPLLRAAIVLGVHPALIRAWTGMLTQLSRRFIVRHACGPPLVSTTGFAEGCPLSVGAMLICNIVLHHYMHNLAPCIRMQSYVDNWELAGQSVQEVQEAVGAIQQFATLLDLQIDDRKTMVWAITGNDRKELREWGPKVIKNVRDLGGHLQFTKQQTNGTVAKKCDQLKSLWKRLACSRAPISHKCRVVRVKAWPRALHASPGVHICTATFDDLRAIAFRPLGIGKAGVNSKLYWSLVVHPAHDPECYAILASVRFYQKFVDSCWASPYLAHAAERHERARCPGPLGVLISRLEAVGWRYIHQDMFADQHGLSIGLQTMPSQEVTKRLCEAFQQKTGQECSKRKGYSGLHRVDAQTTALNQKGLSVDQQGLVRALLTGAFVTADQQAVAHSLEDNEKVCKFCGNADSLMHRHWECKFTESSRSKIQPEDLKVIREQPSCFQERGWAVEPEGLWEFRKLLQCQPDLTGEFFVAPEPGSEHDYFTDGAGLHPNDPKCRVVAWAWCLAVRPGQCSFCTGASGGVPGIWQTVARAEATSVLSVLRCMIRYDCGGRVWSDNQLVVDRITNIQRNGMNEPFSSDHDLWEVIGAMVMKLGKRMIITKVFSHQPDDLNEVESWICSGNDAADKAASFAIDQLQSEIREANQKLVIESQKIRRAHKAMIDPIVRVGFQSVMQKVEVKAPKTIEVAEDGEINTKLVVQKVRGSVPASLTFTHLHKWLGWFENITDQTSPIRWVAWHELLIHFQQATEMVGVRCNYVTYGNHRQWDLIPEGESYNFVAVSKAFAQYGTNLVKIKYPQWKAKQGRPANPRFHMWCNCIPLRVSKVFQKTIEDWFAAIGMTGVFRKIGDLQELEPAVGCGPSA